MYEKVEEAKKKKKNEKTVNFQFSAKPENQAQAGNVNRGSISPPNTSASDQSSFQHGEGYNVRDNLESTDTSGKSFQVFGFSDDGSMEKLYEGSANFFTHEVPVNLREQLPRLATDSSLENSSSLYRGGCRSVLCY